MRRTSVLIVIVLLMFLFPIGWRAARAVAAAAPSQGKQLLSADQIKLLFLLMDTDKDGKISKQEWVTFMSSTFDHLDLGKTGKLDPKELSQLTIPGITFASAGR